MTDPRSPMKLEPVSVEDLEKGIGLEVGVSPWREVTQSMIDQFADATDDHQFIHVDPVRAAETPFGGTIAHGFLTLSLLSALFFESVRPVKGERVGVNHGFDQVRFVTPVKSGARIRGRFTLAELKIRPSGWINIAHDVVLEVEGSAKPAMTARWLTLLGPDTAEG
jgi:acyl dehydratase